MALRDLVMGGGACAVPGAPASSSNPLGGLADSLLGSASKTQERLKELPGLVGPGQSSAEFGVSRPLASLPGSEFEQDVSQQSNIQVPEFLRKFHGVDQHGLADAWNEALGVQMPPPPFFQENRGSPAIFSEFEQIYGRDVTSGPPALLDGTPQRVLSGFLRSFLDSSRGEVPFHPVKLPELGLSEADKCRIRDRSSIMARHFFADKGDEYVNAQVNALLHSLDIESELRAWGPQDGRFSELEDHWNETHGGRLYPRQGGNSNIFDNSNQWATEFNQQHDLSNGVENWVNEYQQHEGNVWVDQFGQEQAQMTRAHLRDGDMRNLAALEQTRSLVHTLSQNQDPKFQNSKFLQFVSKMSRGELIVEDNQVKPSVSSEASGWADEFGSQHAGNTESWAAEFTAGEHSHRGDTWVDQYGRERNQESSTSEGWIDDFSKMNMRDWADEFNDQFANGTLGDDNWLNSYEKFVEEQVAGEHKLPSSSRWAYVFADQNPYVGHPNPLKEGHELFRRGLLSEAVLALEAEVLKNPDNAEGWRLLGITHAENDDDRQAIASMVRARDADPTNLEVLLALGVSHTNELEQHEALKYLRGWLQHHPKYGRLVPSDQTERLNHLEVTPLFHEAAQMSPEDGDVHTVLGVLYNLSREYDKAIAAFQTALKLKPRDYSLWNKLGATQANSARSADAIHAYQEALDLKPNYVRAWSNMGISYANQGRYEESIRYYVRALCMNPKADNAWQYLRISLSCAARTDLLDACDRRDLDSLQKEFPM